MSTKLKPPNTEPQLTVPFAENVNPVIWLSLTRNVTGVDWEDCPVHLSNEEGTAGVKGLGAVLLAEQPSDVRAMTISADSLHRMA
jgi:hypothetical protein